MGASERTFIIYMHTAPNGKRYVGQTCQRLRARWNNGKKYYDQSYFGRAIKKYGWENFKHEILCVVHHKSVADLFEQYYIAKYDTFHHDHGYNLTKGGGGTLGRKMTPEEIEKLRQLNIGRPRTEEERRQISETLKEGYASGRIKAKPMSEENRTKLSEERTGEGNPMYGKHHTQEAAKRIGSFHRGRKRNSETKRRISEARYNSDKIKRCPVDQYDLDGNLVGHYESLKDAQEKTGFAASNIGSCARGKYKQAYGFIWRYAEKAA